MARKGIRMQGRKATNVSARTWARRSAKTLNRDVHDMSRVRAVRNVVNDYLEEYPNLNPQEIKAVVEYVSSLPQIREVNFL